MACVFEPTSKPLLSNGPPFFWNFVRLVKAIVIAAPPSPQFWYCSGQTQLSASFEPNLVVLIMWFRALRPPGPLISGFMLSSQ